MHEPYLSLIPSDRNKLVRRICKKVKELQPLLNFDGLCGMGISGITTCSMVGYRLKLPLCIVRKDIDKCNSSRLIEYQSGIKKVLILDDQICTGHTVKHMLTRLTEENIECVGAVLHNQLKEWTNTWLSDMGNEFNFPIFNIRRKSEASKLN